MDVRFSDGFIGGRVRSRIGSILGRGVLSGLVGTAALSLGEPLETRLLGRRPVYAALRLATRLASRFSFTLGTRHARSLALVMRWSYGVTLGIAGMTLDPARGARVERALAYGAMIWAGELVMLPLVGATPPLRRWSKAELLLLGVHTSIFALGAETCRCPITNRALHGRS